MNNLKRAGLYLAAFCLVPLALGRPRDAAVTLLTVLLCFWYGTLFYTLTGRQPWPPFRRWPPR